MSPLTADVDKIIISEAEVFVTPYSSNPTDPVSSNVLDVSSYDDMGYLKEEAGVEIQPNEEYLDAHVSSSKGAVKSQSTREGYMVKFASLDSDLEKTSRASAGRTFTAAASPGTNPDKSAFGDKATTSYWTVVVRGVNQHGLYKIYVLWKVQFRNPGPAKFINDAWFETPFEGKGFTEPNKTAGERLFIEYDITPAP